VHGTEKGDRQTVGLESVTGKEIQRNAASQFNTFGCQGLTFFRVGESDKGLCPLGFCFAGVLPLHPPKNFLGKRFLDFQKRESTETAK